EQTSPKWRPPRIKTHLLLSSTCSHWMMSLFAMQLTQQRLPWQPKQHEWTLWTNQTCR
ncbi:Uncharacterized protein APZ42_009940, partial [Daphnia magna]